MPTNLKNILLAAARNTGVFALARCLYRERVRLLAYHGVDEADDPVMNWDGLQVSEGVFREQLEVLARCCTVVPLVDIIRAIREGRKLPPNSACITFDDGYRNNLRQAAPILREFGFPATFFITTGFVDGTAKPWWYCVRQIMAASSTERVSLPGGEIKDLDSVAQRKTAARAWEDYLKRLPAGERGQQLGQLSASHGDVGGTVKYTMLSWDEVRKLAEMGFEVAPHTVTHLSFGVEDAELLRGEVEESVARIQAETKLQPQTYSYPFGQESDLNPAVAGILEEHGIIGAVTTLSGMCGPGDNPYSLKRLNVGEGYTGGAFDALISGC